MTSSACCTLATVTSFLCGADDDLFLVVMRVSGAAAAATGTGRGVGAAVECRSQRRQQLGRGGSARRRGRGPLAERGVRQDASGVCLVPVCTTRVGVPRPVLRVARDEASLSSESRGRRRGALGAAQRTLRRSAALLLPRIAGTVGLAPEGKLCLMCERRPECYHT